MKTISLCFLLATAAAGEIHQNPGSATPLPHQKYIHVVSDADSPVQQTYIKSKDGLYIAAAIRKPKGYRSGESEYLIDGRAARLRDIQDIFMGTGLGPESYAIIEQGRIEIGRASCRERV